MTFVELFAIMIDFFATILMDILPILAYILWLIICAIILIFIYIIFALTLVVVILSFVIFSSFSLLVSTFIHGQVNINFNSVSIQKDDDIMKYKYEIVSITIPFFAFSVPTIQISFSSKNETYTIPYNFFVSNFNLPNQTTIETLYSNESLQSSGLKTSSTDSEEKIFSQFWNGVVLMIGTVSAIFSLTSACISSVIHYSFNVIAAFFAGVSIFFATYFILTYSLEYGWMTESFSYGLSIGSLVMIVVLGIFGFTGKSWSTPVKSILTMFGMYYSLISNYNKWYKMAHFDALKIPSLLSVLIGLIFTILSIRKMDQPRRIGVTFLFISILIIVWAHFVMLPIWLDLESY